MPFEGSCSIGIRDMSKLPQTEVEFRKFVADVMAPEIATRMWVGAGITATRDLNIELKNRGIEISCGGKWTF